MFTSIVVALDLQEAGDRAALPVACSVAALGDVPVELLMVTSSNRPADHDAFELRRRASAHGWPVDSFSVIDSDDVARAVVDHVQGRDNALLVMASSATAPLSRPLRRSTSGAVIGEIERPVLLVGPHVPADFELRLPTLIACIDTTDTSDAAVPAIAAWMRTFRSSEPWIAQVVAKPVSRPEAADLTGCAHARHYAGLLAAQGVEASWELVHGGDAVTSLVKFADDVTDPVLVATSTRWTCGRRHSVTRQLVRRSTWPVLVVPLKCHRAPAGVAFEPCAAEGLAPVG